MAKTNRVQKELQLATGIKCKKGEAEQEYLARLVQSLADLPEDAWNKLSEPAQVWFNAAAEAVNLGVAVAPPIVILAEEPKESKKVKSPASKDTVKEEKKKTYEVSATGYLFEFFLENPDASVEAAMATLVAAGKSVAKSTTWSVKQSTRAVLAAQQRLKDKTSQKG